ncbi:dipeptide/oligopeptide/nickel ABC transporter permease/ATP-binding protein [Actinobacillus pleuropneumoniae]|uniref:Dipeptide/oligopeptide/nickel ABC transporter permease/ATP-binding protein n=2 Tax=Actinobacillus pleuropneumoniae TaxID=715 RepID=A0A9Q4DHS3_ACTPL|nr:dipeptide/oligopeptide/nickel ABC transporter permease/ATP-binding protein [Actinobacillus pleuropneumoniae]MBT9318292.1 dipeptide/oligopeptide/nickel ABC transporter permease/ATP-binding protein [Actinobacillus pleuropneumoniae]MBT9342996.1 dipeptide/oligopeptide/nickel ABC transporter permease/ATP-binding protein [Actinobacillus pleuropneumoniae]MCL7721523.1 dipeptide/oligopeptide/nickel ABC transporter permease/ATP-binding protein [Actinobacillus pleuropneumoniae]MCL7727243.1 dipeptide/ol
MFRQGLAARLANGGARFRALSTSSKIALIFILFVACIAILAPIVAPYDPLQTLRPVQAPSGDYLFGTDRLGRDIFSRMVWGARTSLFIGLGAVGVAILFGGILGATAATADKFGNEVIMRLMDILMAFPGIALAAVLLATFGNSVPVIIITIAVVYTPQLARVVRANVVSQWEEDYVRAERVLGGSRTYILLKHVVRNTAAPVLVFATVMVADAIVFEASLSFLGAGVQPPFPSWGNILSEGRNLVLSGFWWATTFAGIMILLTVLALNILAEGLTDALVNPKLKTSPKTKEDVAKPLSTDVQEAMAETLALKRYLLKLHEKETTRTDRMQLNPNAKPILQVKNLSIRFPNRYGEIPLVDNISFTVHEGETMGLVGESGCGKSITAFSIMGLLPKTAQITGEILFTDRSGKQYDLLKSDQLNELRGHEISMIYQDALSALNPSMRIKDQMAQLISRGGKQSAETLLQWVKLDPEKTLNRYPHELSGGQRQRVLIAMALAREPKLLIADEPTTALDVVVQAEVIKLLNELREKLGFAMVFVSHDLALVAQMAHHITVMYAGQVVEAAPTTPLLANPTHEYTRGLLGSVLSTELRAERLYQIPGSVPSPFDFAKGDRFASRSLRPEADPEQHLQLVATDDHPQHFWASHLATQDKPAEG